MVPRNTNIYDDEENGAGSHYEDTDQDDGDNEDDNSNDHMLCFYTIM